MLRIFSYLVTPKIHQVGMHDEKTNTIAKPTI